MTYQPNILVQDSSVTVWWNHQTEVTTFHDNGDITTAFTPPSRQVIELYDKDQAIDFVLDLLKDANLGQKTWDKISDHLSY